jgi:hypothetical protein
MSTNNGGNFRYPYVTPEEFKQVLGQIGAQMGKDEKQRVERMNDLIRAFNEVRGIVTQAGTAFNQLSEIVDNLALHLRFCMEKCGGFDAAGNPTEEFKAWCAKAIDEANAARAVNDEAVRAQQAQNPEPIEIPKPRNTVAPLPGDPSVN